MIIRRQVRAIFSALGGSLLVMSVAANSNVAQEKVAQPELAALGESFAQHVKPFLAQHCVRCHHGEKQTSGVRVDQLDASLADRHMKLWEAIARLLRDESMPPDDEPQPTAAQRERVTRWIEQALLVARARPTPKNGSIRRLTVAQYRNTLRELLLLEDNLADVLPADAVSRDGFLNNHESLQLSPLLLETYYDIAEQALQRTLVDGSQKPQVQNFRVDLGLGINADPCRDQLILGAGSLLLDNRDFVVTQLTPRKPFAVEPRFMQTKFRFIEGYAGNSTVRGWREYDSIYHAVFACMRGTNGYPKGHAYDTVPQGLLLRPAIPSEELFGVESTYGPRANFKLSLRELPDHGRFRITVRAAKYNDGLLLDRGTAAQPDEVPQAIVCRDPEKPQTIHIAQAGIYQVDIHRLKSQAKPPPPEAARLGDNLIGHWSLDGHAQSQPVIAELTGKLQGEARFAPSPFGQALVCDGDGDALVVPRDAKLNVATGDFTVAAWIHPRKLQQGGIVCLGKYGWTQGWYLDMPNNQGVLRIESADRNSESNGSVSSPRGALRVNTWQHVAAVVRRSPGRTQLYVNGYAVADGSIGPADLDNPRVDLHLGRIQGAQGFQGELDEVRIYRRALSAAELQALVEPGRRFVTPPPPEKPQDVTLSLGERRFQGTLGQAAFVAVRLDAGALAIRADYAGSTALEKLVLTPLAAEDELTQRFAAFERRSPRIGVHLGFRRDCGSTLAPVGAVQTVASQQLESYLFEGAIQNYPSPDVEANNVNYLAGVREIGVRSEYTDGRDMPRLLIRSVEFEGPFYDRWPPESHQQVFFASPQQHDPLRYAREIITRFASCAFRRPATAEEVAALMKVFSATYDTRRDFTASVKDALQVVLTSPQFLFLIEHSTTSAGEPLEPYELAAKLSYFLWNSPPDQRLLDLAGSGKLFEQLDSETVRLLADPRAQQFLREFAAQWLSLEKFDVLEPNRQLFPRLTRDTRAQLRLEPVRYLEYLVRENRPVRELIASDVIVANEVVASYYDLGAKVESGLEFVPIVHGRSELGGLFSQAAILAGLSDGRESNPVKRGAWLARKIIAEPPDDPPPNVPALEETSAQLTLRERLERHRNQPGCAQCHAKIDPWGMPFEEFDAGGRWKTTPVDARSVLPDRATVSGVAELRRHLAHDRIDQVALSVLKHLAIYATGRSLTYNELEFLKRRGLELQNDEYRMQNLIRFVVKSPLFLEK